MTGKQFKVILDERGLSQRSVAKEIGVSYSTINSFLNRTLGDLKKSKYYRLCKFLGVDVLF